GVRGRGGGGPRGRPRRPPPSAPVAPGRRDRERLSSPPMQHVLVTGGAGFIGANFVRWLLREETAVRVVTLDALTYAGSLRNLEGLPDPTRHTFVQGEVQDGPLVARLLREHDVDAVVHFAAETHVDRSILGPRRFVETNVVGTFTLLEAARQAWRGRRDVRFHH